jgi:hypothetical protein
MPLRIYFFTIVLNTAFSISNRNKTQPPYRAHFDQFINLYVHNPIIRLWSINKETLPICLYWHSLLDVERASSRQRM